MTLTQKVQEAELVQSGIRAESSILHDIDFMTAPIEEVYAEMVRVWQEVVELFGIKNPRSLPTLSMFDIPYFDTFQVDFYPTIHTSIRKYAYDVIRDHIHSPAFYNLNSHIVFLNRSQAGSLSFVEEVTHSLIYTGELPLAFPIEQLRGYSGEFFRGLYKTVKSLGWPRFFSVDTDEFFPPIAQQALLGETDNFELQNPAELKGKRFFFPKATSYDKIVIKSWLTHLPQLAGERLVRSYEGDVQRLIQEHPNLADMGCTSLWCDYCLPLLVSGQFEGRQTR